MSVDARDSRVFLPEPATAKAVSQAVHLTIVTATQTPSTSAGATHLVRVTPPHGGEAKELLGVGSFGRCEQGRQVVADAFVAMGQVFVGTFPCWKERVAVKVQHQQSFDVRDKRRCTAQDQALRGRAGKGSVISL